MKYLRSPGDTGHLGWGDCEYLFEIDDENVVVRQIERYGNGNLLLYGRGHPDDKWGGLADQEFSEAWGLPAEHQWVTREDFERAWTPAKAFNRR